MTLDAEAAANFLRAGGASALHWPEGGAALSSLAGAKFGEAMAPQRSRTGGRARPSVGNGWGHHLRKRMASFGGRAVLADIGTAKREGAIRSAHQEKISVSRRFHGDVRRRYNGSKPQRPAVRRV